MEQPRQRQDFARRIARSFLRDGEPFAIRNARKVDARGVRDHAWVVSVGESLVAVGTSDDDCETACTTRQVLSLITNPFDTICDNLRTIRGQMDMRSDILGVHLEGPFLAASRKGAHNPECLCDPVDGLVDDILRAADGCLRQITIAPELPHGISAIRRFADAGVVPPVQAS